MLDLISIRFSPNRQCFDIQSFKICRGHTKPRFEAPDLKSHQFWQSWCQIKGNLSQNIDVVLI